MTRRRRHVPRHSWTPVQNADTTMAALAALWSRDVRTTRKLLATMPAATVAGQILPVAETLLVLVAERARRAPPVPGVVLSPVCSGGFCYSDVPCYVTGCEHKCHRKVGEPDDTVVFARSG